jgi:hypothetical protein
LALSPLLNLSTKIWYQITFFAHDGGSLNGEDTFCAFTKVKVAEMARSKTIKFFIMNYFKKMVA